MSRYAVPLLVTLAASGRPAALGFVPSHFNRARSPCPLWQNEHLATQRDSSNIALAAGDPDTVDDPDSSSEPPSDKYAEKVDWDWQQMAIDVFEDDKRPIVLFDGVCNLCNGGVNFAMDQDETARLRFASLQSKVAQSLLLRCGKSPTDTSSIVYVTEDGAFYSSDAVSHICMDLDAKPLRWFGKLGQFTPSWIRESIYQFVSNNRYQFGENDSCRLDFDGTYTSRFVSDPMNNKGDSGLDTSGA